MRGLSTIAAVVLAAMGLLSAEVRAERRRAVKSLQWAPPVWVDPKKKEKKGVESGEGSTSVSDSAAMGSGTDPNASSTLLQSLSAGNRGKGVKSTANMPAGSSAAGQRAEPLRIGYDDNAPKSQEGGKYGRGGDGPGGGTAGPGGGNRNRTVAFDRWWPACIFVDPVVRNANAIIKGVVDMAARCGVNLVVYPFYLKGNYPKNAATLNQRAKRMCNAVDGLKSMGVNRASVATLVNNQQIVSQMCRASGAGPNDLPGCSELGYDPGKNYRLRMANAGQYGGVAGVGNVASSVIGPGGFNPQTVAKYLQGMAQMAMPNGVGAGLVGTWDEGNASGGSKPERNWNERGCAQMRAASFPNDGKWRWVPNQEKYLVRGDERNFIDLNDNTPLFKPPQGPPGAGAVAAGGGGGGGGAGAGGGTGASVASAGSTGDPSGTARAVGGGVIAGSGHKNKSGQVGRGSGIKSVANIYGGTSGGADGAAALANLSADPAAENGEALVSGFEGTTSGAGTAAIPPIGSGTGNGSSATGAPASGVNPQLALGFDDSVNKGGLSPVNYGAAAGAYANSNVPANGAPVAGDRSPASGAATISTPLATQVKNGSKVLEDDFFKKIGKAAQEDKERRSGSRDTGGRRSVRVYQ